MAKQIFTTTDGGSTATPQDLQPSANELQPGGATAPAWWLKASLWEALRWLQVATWLTDAAPRLPNTGTVTWPDGSAGDYTTIAVDEGWRAITEFTVTHTGSAQTVTVELALDAEHGELSIDTITVA